ncbi:MAG: CBS domain-containing protein [Candidatus Altiarchaeum hamiconexum]|uniref:CBS domain-containing protein n=1 Tax=Candidatus Altarchaeum hamiconexum TaxID=1803513 RepID=A0A8J8CEH3_9ARCH|nr:CBS domain-containing protein [Candidatus Altarchaeum hamiconexum]
MAAENVVKAGDVMSKDVVYIDGNATVREAVKTMLEKKVSALIVNARNVDDAFGIVTRKDVVNKIVAQGKDPKAVKVHEIMTKPLITVSPGLSVEYCARLFAKTGIRRAPVFDGKKIVGILSNSDIFKTVA